MYKRQGKSSVGRQNFLCHCHCHKWFHPAFPMRLALLLHTIDGAEERLNRSGDNIVVNAGPPYGFAAWSSDSDIGHSLCAGALLQSVLLIGEVCVLDGEIFLDGVADGVKSAVSRCV